ncbi:MAG: hypothetical protein JNK47_12045 [Mesorhizobium sp.]|nr:hypothetical protein [Mesorhizobium sp.]MBL8577951.1 hypothetical protein [Mesorhizobium sp.]
MVLGMTLTAYTILHVVLSIIGIATGLVAVGGLLAGHRLSITTAIFLITTLATTLGGFLFPYNGFTPAIGVGIVSTVILLIAIAARYVFRLRGSWRWVYVGTAVLALYLNAFVLVVQSFLKVPALNVYAPTGSETPFAVTQGVVLAVFIVLGILSIWRFRPATA